VIPETYLVLPYDEHRKVEVIPLTFGRARITITNGLGVDNSW
jgi:hypothetical protein